MGVCPFDVCQFMTGHYCRAQRHRREVQQTNSRKRGQRSFLLQNQTTAGQPGQGIADLHTETTVHPALPTARASCTGKSSFGVQVP